MSLDILEASAVKPYIDSDILGDLDINSPRKYQVVLYNDDFTPMEFVVRLLKEVFKVNEQEATNIMLQVHNNGKGICGKYVRDIAQTKANSIIEKARTYSYPLFCQAEKV